MAVTDVTFVDGLRGAMIVTAVVCLMGVAAALATGGEHGPTPVGKKASTSMGSIT
jgi:hypothetical protein